MNEERTIELNIVISVTLSEIMDLGSNYELLTSKKKDRRYMSLDGSVQTALKILLPE